MAITDHNKRDRGTLDEIARGHKLACELLEFCEIIFDLWPEKERRFLSAWGAVGQAQGRWGRDIGNVTYATAWHHLLQEADTARWPRCRRVTGRVSAGNVIELLFGAMYLSDRRIQTLEDFAQHANDRALQCYEPVYASTWDLIKRNELEFQLVTQYRFALETYVYGWRHLLFEARSEWSTIFLPLRFNKTWNVKEILFAFEVMRMGHPVRHLEMSKEHPLPPPLKTVTHRTMMRYLCHRDVQPIQR